MYFIENIKRKMKLDLWGGANIWDEYLAPLGHSWLDLESGAQVKGQSLRGQVHGTTANFEEANCDKTFIFRALNVKSW